MTRKRRRKGPTSVDISGSLDPEAARRLVATLDAVFDLPAEAPLDLGTNFSILAAAVATRDPDFQPAAHKSCIMRALENVSRV